MSAPAIGGYHPTSFLQNLLFDPKNGVIHNTNNQINKILLSIKPIGQRWVFNELEELRMTATHSNWDNLGSAPLDDDTYQLAKRFIWALPSSLSAPELTVDRDGEINFDWFGLRGRMLTVSLRKDGRIAYACRISQRRNYSGTEEFIDSIPKKIVESIKAATA
jgi:hypothetical protein